MTPDDARAAVQTLPGAPLPPDAEMRSLSDGWSSHVFTTGPDWIVRFPRTDAAARGLARERRLLPLIGESVSFAVPRIEHVGDFAGRPFAMYRRVPGQAFQAGSVDSYSLAAALTELHSVSPEGARRAVDGTPGWRAKYEALQGEMADRVLPLLAQPVAERAEQGFASFLGTLDGAGPERLVHADLGAAHILVDDGRVTGMIDFESAALGDPAVDLIGIRLSAGADTAREVIRRHPYLDDAAAARLDFYTWMGTAHAIISGLDTERPSRLNASIASLTERIDWSVAAD